ncbi:MAG: O-methyltransferase [Candidatus Heimdallarchaeota archaeon]|nr:O-methyltransferase [Candidatus Heimdallarchaeota archaeon]
MKKELINLLIELEKIDTEERQKGLPVSVRMRNITPDVGLFLNMMVKTSKSKTILEIGTSNAYSTIWLGLAAKDNNGKIITLELDPRKISLARENLTKAGLIDIVQIIEGDAKESIKSLNIEFDFVFLDAEKEDYIDYFNLVFPKIKPGGIIIADNVVSHSEELKDYLEHVRSNPNTQSILIPVGRGEELTIKLR